MIELAPGRVMVDVEGLELSARERRRLEHPACAGVILFKRNYQDRQQLRALCEQIKSLRQPALLIAVDHEGGRVQRFRDGFSRIPPMRAIGALWDKDREQARAMARDAGLVIAVELGACGIDFSFAPVLDIDHGFSTVIGDRSFHSDAAAVTELARAFISGLGAGGMIAVGKHFPGHGGVSADTHHQSAVDHRDFVDIERNDMQPFVALCRGTLAAVMPAHVVYDKVDARPAGFSSVWLQQILRQQLGFEGIVFSDDLSMHGAGIAGDAPARARAALSAGCDIALVCNAPDDAEAVMDSIDPAQYAIDPSRLAALQRKPVGNAAQGDDYLQASRRIAELSAAASQMQA